MTTNLKRFPRSRSIAGMALLTILFLFSPMLHAEKWRQHPGLDNLPVRIIDTEKYTLFQVFQKYYHTGRTSFETPVTAGLVYSKDAPAKGIIPLGETFNVGGASIRGAEYSPEGGFLALINIDGSLDFISDSGEVRHNDELTRCFLPGWGDINSMTLSGTEIWVATPGGYLAVDGKSGRTLALTDLQQPIDWIARCGKNVVAISDGKFYISDKENLPRSMADFRVMPIADAPANPKVLMPRSDGSFAFVVQKSGSSHTLNVAYQDNGAWKNRTLFDVWVPTVNQNMVISHPYEMNFTRNRDGWLICCGENMVQLKVEGPATGDLTSMVPLSPKSNPTGGRYSTVLGSWDGTSCWTYYDRGRFSRGELTEGRMLIDDAAAVRPNLPAVSQSTSFDYSPKFGLTTVNYGCTWNFLTLNQSLPPLVSCIKDGVWSLPSPAYNVPRSAEANPELEQLYKNYLYRFPVNDPTGIAFDSENGDYAWVGSTFGGLAALNLNDVKADPLHFGAPSDPLAGYPGFKAILENEQGWGGYNPLSAPSFDSDGTLWSANHHIDGSNADNSKVRLYYWPKENRKKVLDSGDVSLTDGIGVVNFPCDYDNNAPMKALATKHPLGRNLVFLYVAGYPRYLLRYNHKGTLDKRNDDVLDNIFEIEDQFGGRWNISYCHDIKEDPATGMIWVAESTTLLSFDPTAEVKDGVIKGRVLDIEYPGGARNPLSQISCNGLVFDSAGRLWVSTMGLGVWGISADRTKAEAHYMVANSGLPSDNCYGLGWNPKSMSLMISTDDGLAEVWPDAPDATNVSGNISVSPRVVKPDYNGSVTIHGLVPFTQVEISCREKEIATVTAGANGSAIWNLRDSEGREVASGFYILSGPFGKVEIAVMR